MLLLSWCRCLCSCRNYSDLLHHSKHVPFAPIAQLPCHLKIDRYGSLIHSDVYWMKGCPSFHLYEFLPKILLMRPCPLRLWCHGQSKFHNHQQIPKKSICSIIVADSSRCCWRYQRRWWSAKSNLMKDWKKIVDIKIWLCQDAEKKWWDSRMML